jgi:hypothetical protein
VSKPNSRREAYSTRDVSVVEETPIVVIEETPVIIVEEVVVTNTTAV